MSNCEPNRDCCISRRQFLFTGATAASLPIIAGPFSARCFAAEDGVSHFVPVDKRLSPAWVQSLTRRGAPRLYQHETQTVLGMPVGGVAAGQMYVTGDGTLHGWWIYNRRIRTGSITNYQQPLFGLRLAQGYAVRIRSGGKEIARTLDREGFPDVGFTGQYPLNRVYYRDDALPVRITMEAYSPFIPLNAEDSALPATLMEFTLENTAQQAVEIDLAGYLENPVGALSRNEGMRGRLRQRVVSRRGTTRIEYDGLSTEDDKRAARPPERFADFEGDRYGDWQAEGAAMGQGPARGAVGRQQPVTGFEGEGLVNTYNPDDSSTGRLLSPEFTIRRPYINFLVGGGSDQERVFLRLLVEGKEEARSAGDNNEALRWKSWDVGHLAGKRARIEIVDNSTGRWGHISVDAIEFADRPQAGAGELTEQTDFGNVCFALLERADGAAADIGPEPARLFGTEQRARESVYPLGETRLGALSRSFSLAPGESRTVRFLLAWYFPLRRGGFYRARQHGVESIGDENIGNYYTNLWKSSGDVVDYVRRHYDRLSGDTRLYHRVFYEESTLPWWMLERIGHTPSILATETVQWRKNGRFWGWEGVGCCGGTCTHVWNYEQALARLFPPLERSMREMQDFDFEVGLQPDGLISFRGDTYTDEPRYAADGQAGSILKAWREHLVGEDDAFLRRNWPSIKLALEYCIARDANDDGLIEDRQHNTYDCDFYGANTMVGSLYLGALRAGEEMARLMAEPELARRYRAIFESGSRKSVERLWDGEYFIQDPELSWQRGRRYDLGCLSDQLLGQSLAIQLGLGRLYPEDKVRSALASIYKYNWTPDVMVQNKVHTPHRWFAVEGEAGLFICTWPKSPRPGPRAEVSYRNEVWTGIEYQVAANMIYEGMVQEGLAIIRGVHDRHDGRKQNPFNEVECGEHYSRAMAAWGCLLAACGFQYDGPRGVLGFSPRMQREDFRAFFSGARGWGSLTQKEADGRRTCRVELAWGDLQLTELELDGAGVDADHVTLRVNGRARKPRSIDLRNGTLIVSMAKTRLSAGDHIEVVAPLA